MSKISSRTTITIFQESRFKSYVEKEALLLARVLSYVLGLLHLYDTYLNDLFIFLAETEICTYEDDATICAH